MLDTWVEDFDGRTADATIDGQELWTVTAGSPSNAVVQNSVAVSGNALKIAAASTPVTVGRSTTYGGLTPTWVRFVIRPGVGNETRTAPTSGVAAVSFDASGQVLAADGTSWVNTGVTYATDSWWEVIYKLNFTSKTYDVYVGPAATPATGFAPVKSGLNFISSSTTGLSALTFAGAYSTTTTAHTYLDNLIVNYVERVGIATAAQTLVQGAPSGPIAVALWNNNLESQKAPADIALQLTSSSPGGRFSLSRDQWTDITQVTIPKDTLTATFYYKDSAVGKPTITVRPFPTRGWLEAFQQQQVIAKASHFEVAAASPQVAGTPFALTLTAKTEDGSVDETYLGSVRLEVAYVSPVTGTKVMTPAGVSGFSKGVAQVTAIYPDAGTIQLVATDTADASRSGKSGTILVVPAKLQVTAEPKQVVSKPFPLTITALGADGAATPNYQGTMTLGIQPVSPLTGAGTLTPGSLTAESAQGGKTTGNVTYPRWGAITVTATDAAVATVTGTSGVITCAPETLRLTVTPPPSPRTFFYTQELFDVEAAPLGFGGGTIPNYQGTVEINAPTAMTLPQTYSFLESEVGVHHFKTSSATAGAYTIQAKEPAAGLTSDAASVTVKQAILTVVSTLAPVGGATEVTILLTDDKGRVITAESGMALNVKLTEAIPNGSISSSALNQAIRIINGKASFLLADTESELVTVTPSSPYGIAVRTGVVSFGRYATKGVGVLLWREIKEEPKP